jgi:hypothetical protein
MLESWWVEEESCAVLPLRSRTFSRKDQPECTEIRDQQSLSFNSVWRRCMMVINFVLLKHIGVCSCLGRRTYRESAIKLFYDDVHFPGYPKHELVLQHVEALKLQDLPFTISTLIVSMSNTHTDILLVSCMSNPFPLNQAWAIASIHVLDCAKSPTRWPPNIAKSINARFPLQKLRIFYRSSHSFCYLVYPSFHNVLTIFRLELELLSLLIYLCK